MKISKCIILLFVSLVYGQYSVEQFAVGSAYPQAGTAILTPQSGKYLAEQSEISSKPLLRRRFSSSEYRLYTGLFADSAFHSKRNIQKFVRPNALNRELFYRLKLYDSQKINSVGDIHDVYFHGDTLFVVGLIRLFYCERGTWKMLEALGTGGRKKTGDVAIRSNPSGAMIILNGESTGVTTPNYLTDVPEGECHIRVVQNECVSRDTVIQITPSEINQVNFDLRTCLGSVNFEGTPRGAKVILDGQVVGTIPCRVDNLIPRQYQFTVDDPFYQKRVLPVEVHSGETTKTFVALSPAFGVIVLPEVSSNRWWTINGERVASGALRYNRGTHRIFWDGGELYRSIDTVIQLVLGDTVRISAHKEVQTGSLKVLPIPMSCSLFVDGLYYGETPSVVRELAVGPHRVDVVKNGYRMQSRMVTVEGGSVAEVRVELAQSGSGGFAVAGSAGELSFVSMNGQARVYHGDSLVAITGKGSVKIPAGRYEFRFESAQESQVKTVTVAGGERKAVLVSFLDR